MGAFRRWNFSIVFRRVDFARIVGLQHWLIYLSQFFENEHTILLMSLQVSVTHRIYHESTKIKLNSTFIPSWNCNWYVLCKSSLSHSNERSLISSQMAKWEKSVCVFWFLVLLRHKSQKWTQSCSRSNQWWEQWKFLEHRQTSDTRSQFHQFRT